MLVQSQTNVGHHCLCTPQKTDSKKLLNGRSDSPSCCRTVQKRTQRSSVLHLQTASTSRACRDVPAQQSNSFLLESSVCTAGMQAYTHTHTSSHAMLRSRACNAGGRTHRGGKSPQVVVGKEEPLQSKLLSQWDSCVVRRLQQWRAFRARTATAGGGNKGSIRRLSALPFAHSPLLVQGLPLQIHTPHLHRAINQVYKPQGAYHLYWALSSLVRRHF